MKKTEFQRIDAVCQTVVLVEKTPEQHGDQTGQS